MARDEEGSKSPPPTPHAADADDVIPIRDLTPRQDVKGGRKIVLGEIVGERPSQ